MKLKDYFKKAQKERWAIGQFNFSTYEQLRGIFEAARELKSPVILGSSEGESKFFGLKEAVALVKVMAEEYGVPAFLNLDHGKDMELLKKAGDCGYSAVHFDGSSLPFEENIKQTKELVKYAKKKGVLVEGELGAIKGDSAMHQENPIISAEDLAKPEEVARFVKETGVDSLAIAIGNVHGLYPEKPELDFIRLQEIKELTDKFLVLHGGSGILAQALEKTLGFGIVKINFNTEIRVAWKQSLIAALAKDPNEAKPYKILPPVISAIKAKVEEKIKIINSLNKI